MATTEKTGAKTAATKTTTATKKTTKAAPASAAKATATKTAAKATTAKAAPKVAAKPVAKAEQTAVAAAPAAKVTKAPKIAKTPLDANQRRHYVEVAAYFMAERRGFMTGCESEDWLAAEAEIDRLFHEGKLNA
jgi:hypothetical protein